MEISRCPFCGQTDVLVVYMAVVCRTCHARGPDGESIELAIGKWNLATSEPLAPPELDDIAAAREKRELAGLPSVTTSAGPGGVGMDFDLGGPPPPKPRKR